MFNVCWIAYAIRLASYLIVEGFYYIIRKIGIKDKND